MHCKHKHWFISKLGDMQGPKTRLVYLVRMSSWFDKLNTNNADCNDNVNVQIVLTICVWPQCGDCYLFIIFHLIIRYFTKLQKTKKQKKTQKKTNPDISKWLWSNKALCESGVTCLWLLQCQEVKKNKKVLTSSAGNARIPGAPWSVK